MATEADSKARAESSVSFGHPWWRGMSDTSVAVAPAPMQESFSLHLNGLQDSGAMFFKNMHSSLPPHSDRDTAQEQQALKQVPSLMQEHIGTSSSSEMAPIGNSIVLTSHPFQDPTYGGFMTCSQQVNPELYGMHQNRMALPLAMEEEPVYVNAKQYHGIMRRRQIRAKAELEKKVVKNRKPYLHESRHKHALRRARGAGGRFLNTKELNENKDNSEEEVNANSKCDGHPSDSTLSSQYSGTVWWKEQGSKGLMISERHKEELQSNGGRDVHGRPSTYNSQSSGSNDGRGRGGMKMNGFVSVK
ncbi:transcriptional activator HAP2-like [Silene latifolia]|uniref:transcriptional activator HAP2-like n=1 Tax=Silene latifolia TaxID=37657 RepID=UPI003D7850BC